MERRIEEQQGGAKGRCAIPQQDIAPTMASAETDKAGEGGGEQPVAAETSASVDSAATDAKAPASEQVVTPWEVAGEGGIDYGKLIEQFGCQKLEPSMIERVQQLTGKQPHVFLRRGIFFAHR